MLFKNKGGLSQGWTGRDNPDGLGGTGLPGRAFRGILCVIFCFQLKKKRAGWLVWFKRHTYSHMHACTFSLFLPQRCWMKTFYCIQFKMPSDAAVENAWPAQKTNNELKCSLLHFETFHFKYLLRNVILPSSCSNEKSWHFRWALSFSMTQMLCSASVLIPIYRRGLKHA